MQCLCVREGTGTDDGMERDTQEPEQNHVDVSSNRHLIKSLPVTLKSWLTFQRVFTMCVVASPVLPLSTLQYFAL